MTLDFQNTTAKSKKKVGVLSNCQKRRVRVANKLRGGGRKSGRGTCCSSWRLANPVFKQMA